MRVPRRMRRVLMGMVRFGHDVPFPALPTRPWRGLRTQQVAPPLVLFLIDRDRVSSIPPCHGLIRRRSDAPRATIALVLESRSPHPCVEDHGPGAREAPFCLTSGYEKRRQPSFTARLVSAICLARSGCLTARSALPRSLRSNGRFPHTGRGEAPVSQMAIRTSKTVSTSMLSSQSNCLYPRAKTRNRKGRWGR